MEPELDESYTTDTGRDERLPGPPASRHEHHRDAGRTATPEAFRLSSRNKQQDTSQEEFADAPGGVESLIAKPVSGAQSPSTAVLDPGERTDGWFVFRLPDSGSTVRLELLVDDTTGRT